jgi:hypothetical protein
MSTRMKCLIATAVVSSILGPIIGWWVLLVTLPFLVIGLMAPK